jgi:hypothetical protein
MLFLASIFTLWTVGFWLALLVASVFIIAFDAFEHEGRSFGTLLIFAGGVLFFNPSAVLAIRHNPLLLIVGLVGYLLLGVLVAVVKWYFFLLNVRDKINDNDFMPGNSKTKYVEVRARPVALPVSVKNFKTRIIGWMTYWPWVAIWTLIDDPIRRVFLRIYHAMAAKLQAMADRIVPKVKEPEPEKNNDPFEPPFRSTISKSSKI